MSQDYYKLCLKKRKGRYLTLSWQAEAALTWQESTLPCRNPAHIMLEVIEPLYTGNLLHTLESMIFTKAFCSVEGISAERQLNLSAFAINSNTCIRHNVR